MTENYTQFTSKFFATLCNSIGTEQLMTAAYHPQSNEQVGRYKKTIKIRIRHYVGENQRDWDKFVQQLTCANISQVHSCTNTTPFSLVLSRHSPGPASYGDNSAFLLDTCYITEPHALRAQLLARVKALHAQADTKLESAQNRY